MYNPSWLLVRTEQCLQTNMAIDKRNCSWRISRRVINGHPLSQQKGEHLGLGDTSEHAAWTMTWSVNLSGGVDRRRERARREQWGPAEGGRGGAQRWAPQIFSHHHPLGHRRLCRTLWVTSPAQLINSGKLITCQLSPSTCEDLLLSTALLTLLPCLGLTVAVLQPLA